MKAPLALKHDSVGTEHILLGLTHDSDDVEFDIGRQALANLGVTLDQVRTATLTAIGKGDYRPAHEPTLSPAAREVIGHIHSEAIRLGHQYVGPEHILLALLRQGDGVAAQILHGLGVDHAAVERQVVALSAR